jgi:hypothetical protein
MNVYAKLNAARVKFHALELKKTGHNKFAGYTYFELGDFLIPALQVFNEVGLCAVVSFTKDVATMTIIDVDSKAPDDMAAMSITSPFGHAALKGMHEIQNIGACETYSRRYLWVAALEIVEHDALDATSGKEAPKSVAREVASQTPMDSLKREEVDNIGSDILAAWTSGQEMDVLKMWGKIEDNDIKIAVWSWLASESKLRSFIKANKAITKEVA